VTKNELAKLLKWKYVVITYPNGSLKIKPIAPTVRRNRATLKMFDTYDEAFEWAVYRLKQDMKEIRKNITELRNSYPKKEKK